MGSRNKFKVSHLAKLATSDSEKHAKPFAAKQETFLKGLILAQNERWRRGLGMQVEREP